MSTDEFRDFPLFDGGECRQGAKRLFDRLDRGGHGLAQLAIDVCKGCGNLQDCLKQMTQPDTPVKRRIAEFGIGTTVVGSVTYQGAFRVGKLRPGLYELSGRQPERKQPGKQPKGWRVPPWCNEIVSRLYGSSEHTKTKNALRTQWRRKVIIENPDLPKTVTYGTALEGFSPAERAVIFWGYGLDILMFGEPVSPETLAEVSDDPLCHFKQVLEPQVDELVEQG